MELVKKLAEMQAPSVSELLARRGYTYEASVINQIVEATNKLETAPALADN